MASPITTTITESATATKTNDPCDAKVCYNKCTSFRSQM